MKRCKCGHFKELHNKPKDIYIDGYKVTRKPSKSGCRSANCLCTVFVWRKPKRKAA